MPRTVRYRVRFRTHDLAGLLDMLRYDGATVTDWDRLYSHEERLGHAEWWSVTLTVTGREPTLDRWRSFGLYPEVLI